VVDEDAEHALEVAAAELASSRRTRLGLRFSLLAPE
jgi:hypothetical protein